MHSRTFTLAATKPSAGLALREMFLGAPGVIVYAVILFPSALGIWFTGDMNVFGVSLSILLSLLFIVHLFIRQKLESDDQEALSEENLAEFLSSALTRELRGKTPTGQSLLIAALQTPRAAFMLKEMGTDPSTVLTFCSRDTETFDLIAFMEEAVREMTARGETKICGSLVLFLFFRHGGELTKLLNDCDLSMNDLEKILDWEILHARQQHDDPMLSPRFLLRSFGGIGRSWVMGYTHTLDRFTSDMSEGILWKSRRQVVLRQAELETMRRIVRRSAQRNILILGKSGTGKRTLVENFTYELRRLERSQGNAYTRVLVLHAERLLSAASQPDRALLQAFSQAEQAGNFVLVIPNMGLLLQAADRNVKNVLVQFLQTPHISLIGLTDPDDYHALMKSDSAMDSLFEKIFLEDSSDDDTMNVLMAQYFKLERRGIRITYKALKSIVDLSHRFVADGGFPGRAMKVMEDAILIAAQKRDSQVTESHIREVISLKAHMNVKHISDGEREQLMHLEDTLKQKIVGQEKALHGLVSALKRARLDIGTRKRPLGTFLFLGPTGVGKTETAKVLAEVYFGSRDRIVRLDMNEYGTESSIEEIIGSSRSSQGGFLTKKIQDEPFSLVLLDEIEKAHPHVLNLFLQILDEGRLTDGRGVKTDFRNTIIIATSNAGALFIRDFFKAHPDIEQSQVGFKEKLFEAILQQKLFSPEFLNRFDDVALYLPLTPPQALQLAILMLDRFIKDFEEKRGVTVIVEQAAIEALAKKGYSIEFGAREMQRVLMDTVETYLAEYILKNSPKRGEAVTITKEGLGL